MAETQAEQQSVLAAKSETETLPPEDAEEQTEEAPKSGAQNRRSLGTFRCVFRPDRRTCFILGVGGLNFR